MDDGAFESNFDERLCAPGEDEVVRCVRTRPNQEGRLHGFCLENGIVCYLPMRKVWRVATRRAGGKSYEYPRIVVRPMFPGYLFVKLGAGQGALLYGSRDVSRILPDPRESQARLIGEIRVVRQIEAIAQTEELQFNAEVQAGGRFVIENGPWQGVCGRLTKKRGRFLWSVELECVGTVVQATLDPSKYKMTPVEG